MVKIFNTKWASNLRWNLSVFTCTTRWLLWWTTGHQPHSLQWCNTVCMDLLQRETLLTWARSKLAMDRPCKRPHSLWFCWWNSRSPRANLPRSSPRCSFLLHRLTQVRRRVGSSHKRRPLPTTGLRFWCWVGTLAVGEPRLLRMKCSWSNAYIHIRKKVHIRAVVSKILIHQLKNV